MDRCKKKHSFHFCSLFFWLHKNKFSLIQSNFMHVVQAVLFMGFFNLESVKKMAIYRLVYGIAI